MKRILTVLVASMMALVMASTAFAASEVANAVYGVSCEDGAKLGDKGCLPTDVEEGKPEVKTIVEAIGSGIMTTDEKGNFRPNDQVQAGETLTVLLRILGMPPADAKGDKSSSAVAKGAELGISSKDLKTDEPMSRLDAILMIAKALNIQGTSDPLPFQDSAGLPLEHRRILAAMYKAKLIEGTAPDAFSPNGVLTRYELALLVERILKSYK